MTRGSLYAYCDHPSTRVLSCVVKVEGRNYRMGPYLAPEDLQLLAKVAETHTIAAHNAPFDGAVWERVLKLPEAEWFDTLKCCRRAGLAGGLDQAGQQSGLGGKDKNGARLVDMLCILKGRQPPATHSASGEVLPAFKLLIDYNERDVDLGWDLLERTRQFAEPEVMAVDAVINDRGIPIDRELLLRLRDLYAESVVAAEEEFAAHTAGVAPRSSKQFLEYLQNLGFTPQSIGLDGVMKVSSNKMAMSRLMMEPEAFYAGEGESDGGDGGMAEAFEAVRYAIELRREITGVGSGKVANALAVLDTDDRIRDALIYYGAHTGRWSSRRLQLHNLPSVLRDIDIRKVEPTLDGVREAIAQAIVRAKAKGLEVTIYISEVLGLFLRRLVGGKRKRVVDYSAVEARCTAWLADCDRMLALYRDPHGPSLYCDMAERVFRRPVSKKKDPDEYTLGKALILGCGYGMSGAKFEMMSHQRESRTTIEKWRASGVKASDAVKIYRETYPEVPRLWAGLTEAIKHTVATGEPTFCGRTEFQRIGRDMHAVLPSGRALVYRNIRIEPRIPAYCKWYGYEERPMPTVVFDGPRGEGFLYGSRACVAADTRVLTLRGPVPIVEVRASDFVWDGVEWVSTDGPVHQGAREVGEWQGVRMTHDHMMSDGRKWRPSIALDDLAGGCSLAWAASLAPWSYRNSNRINTKSYAYAVDARRLFGGVSDICSKKILMAESAGAVRMSSVAKRFEKDIQVERLSMTRCCSDCGCIVGLVSYLAVPNRLTMLIQGTEVEGSKFIRNGSRTLLSSSSTQKLCQAGMMFHSNLIGRIMPDTMSQAIYDSFLSMSTRATGAILCTRCLERRCSLLQCCGVRSSHTCRGARLCSTCKKGVWKASNTLESVYDLMNCGPRHRYTIVTRAGLGITHNCENISQATCRDFLAPSLVELDRLGHQVVLHVHDEAVCIDDADEDQEQLLRQQAEVMSAPREWAKGFPIKVEGYSGPMWTKFSSGELEVEAQDGVVLSCKREV